MLADTASQQDVDSLLNALRHHFHWPNDAAAPNNTPREFGAALSSLPAVQKPVILVCGHGARDSRCGVMGPLLQRQFQDCLKDEGVDAIVAQITHIGGHKFAGNVILYVPPSAADSGNVLAGKNIWYGRVEPQHCEGIVKETILGGNVIEELYRGSMAGAEP